MVFIEEALPFMAEMLVRGCTLLQKQIFIDGGSR